jgi:electron transfer flavoprotein alpha subunit
MGDVLAFIEQRDGSVRGVSREVLGVARQVAGEGGSVHGVVLVEAGGSGDLEGLGALPADRIAALEDASFSSYVPEAWAPALAEAARSVEAAAVVFPATAQGRDLAPRVAALLEVPLASDVTGVELTDGGVELVRPVYAGKAFARLALEARPAVFSIRPNVFAPAEPGDGEVAVEVMAPDAGPHGPTSRVVDFEAAGGGDVDVAEASVVVSGGRGMKEPDNWTLLEELRDALGDDVALGASRAVVDAGWRPHGEQVGQTGKTVAPKLYVAVGISGAIQHLAGMRTSQTIVAVNKDPDAPIFGVADYGIVGDLFEVVPRLTEEVKAVRED